MIALVDARNVLRSKWPNIPEDELVELVRAWAADEDIRAVIVFDGRAPGALVGEEELGDGNLLVGTGSKSADDWIVRAATESTEPYWLVTSDRELRARTDPERTIGGGSFARTITRAGEA